jgi:hypothetical protein
VQTQVGAGLRAVRLLKLSAAFTWVSRPTGRLGDRETGVLHIRPADRGPLNDVFYITVRATRTLSNNSVNLSEMRGQATVGAEESKPRSPISRQTDPRTL